MTHTRYRVPLGLALGGLIVLSWLALWGLDQGPLARIFHAHGNMAAAHNATTGSLIADAGLFIGGWLLMSIAMMLPATYPLIEIFYRLARRRARPAVLVQSLVSGYLLVWTAFGFLAFAFKLVAGALTAGLLPAWLMSSGLLIIAGGFQFSSLKYRCLEQCQRPLSFVLQRWRHQDSAGTAFRIGAEHGVYCVGCCWALMLLMFAAGTAHLLWMFLLALLMGVEKNWQGGKRMSRPTGVGLLVLGVGLAIWRLPGIH